MTNPNKNRYYHRSFGRRIAFQVLYQEELNPGSIDEFSDDFIYAELNQLCSKVSSSDETVAAEIQTVQNEIVNDDVDTSEPISYDDLLELVAFVKQMVAGTRGHRKEIDEKISQVSKNWSIARMAPVDRTLLRMGTYEMTWGKTPKVVVISEVLALAKNFGTPPSIAFINGILDSV